MNAPGWSTRQLTEFLEAISGVGDVNTARRAAVDRAAEALEADVAAIVTDRGVLATIGLDPEQVSGAALAAVREGHSKAIEVPGLGRCVAVSVAIPGEFDASLVVARSGQETFTSEELNVARGLAHALAMAERMLAGRDEEQALRERGEEQSRERQAAEAHYRSLVEQLPAIVYSAEMGEHGRWTYVSPQIEEILGFSPQEWTEDPHMWLNQLHPEDRERALSQENERVLGDRNPPPIDYRLLTRDGKEIWILDEAVLERDQSGKPIWRGVLYDITKRKKAEREVERRAVQQAAVARLGERALKGAELQPLMEDTAAFIAATEEIEQSCVWEFDPGNGKLTLRASAGIDEGQRGAQISVGRDSPVGLAFASGQSVTVSDWSSEARFTVPPYLQGLKVRSTIAAPIEGERESLGVIEAHSEQPDAFSAQDMHFAQSAANVIALAIERRVAGEAVRHGSLHDHVTGLPNRPLFVDRVEHALGAAQGRERPLAIFFLDLDHFKRINDSLGHDKGDEALKAVVPRLHKQLRSVDTVARFGGDEFAILVEEVVDEAEASRIAERICAAFEEPFTLDSIEQHLTVSVGISISGSQTTDGESLIRDAHAAMYRAKDRGRNRAELFDQEMRSKAVRRLQLERELRRALDREELSLHFQPIVALATGEIPALEALLRWDHPERGAIDPVEFIPVAEESGLIHPIGRWVIERACQQSLAWHQLRPDSRPIDMTVNLSARQFAQRDLPKVVAAILSRTGVDAVHLKFEITESVLVEKSGAAEEMMQELSRLGLQLILDDFGTGYSSLSYLNRFPFDAIKIDRSFIEGLGIEQERSAIVEAIVGMAQALDLRTIAEGVENEVQLAELRRLGCGFAQGFLFSGPLPVREMTALLERAAVGSPFSSVRGASPESSREEAPR
jgi:diguanylate cyclase (GGDEF)-like protein/PAS domain S-box-containing protein